MKNKDRRFQVTSEVEGEPVYHMMQYIIDNFDAIEYIRFDETQIIDPLDETEVYFKDGEEHRLDGPAIKYKDGTVDYYIDGDYRSATFYNDPRVLENIRKVRKEKLERLNKND